MYSLEVRVFFVFLFAIAYYWCWCWWSNKCHLCTGVHLRLHRLHHRGGGRPPLGRAQLRLHERHPVHHQHPRLAWKSGVRLKLLLRVWGPGPAWGLLSGPIWNTRITPPLKSFEKTALMSQRSPWHSGCVERSTNRRRNIDVVRIWRLDSRKHLAISWPDDMRWLDGPKVRNYYKIPTVAFLVNTSAFSWTCKLVGPASGGAGTVWTLDDCDINPFFSVSCP